MTDRWTKENETQWRLRDLTWAPDDPPAPATRPMPLVASWDWDVSPYTSESGAQTFTRLNGYGYNGWVVYSGSSLGWTNQMASVASVWGDYPVNLQCTPKSMVANDIRTICNNLPVAWRPGFRWNYYQEPEDNHSTTTQINDYKANVVAASNVLREYPWAQVTWLEFAEYWADTNPTHTADLIPDNHDDFGGILWSFFEYNENVSTSRIDTKVQNVTDFMSTYAPGKPWEIMASCYTLEPGSGPHTTQQQQDQATWLTESYNRLRAAGCTGWAWYNIQFPGTGGAAGEGRVEVNSYALSALQAIAAAGHTVPVLPGNGE